MTFQLFGDGGDGMVELNDGLDACSGERKEYLI